MNLCPYPLAVGCPRLWVPLSKTHNGGQPTDTCNCIVKPTPYVIGDRLENLTGDMLAPLVTTIQGGLQSAREGEVWATEGG